jgi:hypothetical protein
LAAERFAEKKKNKEIRKLSKQTRGCQVAVQEVDDLGMNELFDM